jgi:hypothetical protein
MFEHQHVYFGLGPRQPHRTYYRRGKQHITYAQGDSHQYAARGFQDRPGFIGMLANFIYTAMLKLFEGTGNY